MSHRHNHTGRFIVLVLFTLNQLQQINAQYPVGNLLGRQDNQASTSRDIYLRSHDDFCVFGPAEGGTSIAQSGKNVVSWCSKGDHGTRVIPEGTLQGVTYMKAQNWIQVSGVGDFTKINIKPGDWGGQFDSGENKPEGAKVVAGPDNKEASSWVTLISADIFCFRACFGDPAFCPTDFADKGCCKLLSEGVGPAGTFQSCTSDDGLPPAQQGDTAPEWKDCKTGPAPPGSDASATTASPSTSWAPIQTCIPCTETSSSPTTTPTSTSSTVSTTTNSPETVQQGITRVTGDGGTNSSAGLVAAEMGIPTFLSSPVSPTSAPTSSGDLILKRAEETTTSNGQCCFTTWTPKIVGGAGPTQSASSSSHAAGSSTGTTTSVTPTGSMTANGTSASGTTLVTNSTSARPSSSGTAAINSTARPNGTAGNGSESSGGDTIVDVTWMGAGGFRTGVLCAVVALLGGYVVL